MPQEKPTLGQAIDKIIDALRGLDEKTQENAISAACNQLGIRSPAIEKKAPVPGPGTVSGALQGPTAPKDIRTLKDQKNPGTAIEMACLVAYYLLELAPPAERKESVSIRDMNRYFREGSYPLPTQIKYLLKNARMSGYFEAMGGGAYRLNAVGYNLVAHTLPRKKKL